MNPVLYSKKSDQWATPERFYQDLLKHGAYDPCPLNEQPAFDGLNEEWGYLTYVNPPFSQISAWVDKALEEEKKGKSIIMLLPVRTDTKWFKKLWSKSDGLTLVLISKRITFQGAKSSAPFPCFLALFGFFLFRHQVFLNEGLPTFEQIKKGEFTYL